MRGHIQRIGRLTIAFLANLLAKDEKSLGMDVTFRTVVKNSRAEVLKSDSATTAPPAQPFAILDMAMQASSANISTKCRFLTAVVPAPKA